MFENEAVTSRLASLTPDAGQRSVSREPEVSSQLLKLGTKVYELYTGWG